MPNRLIHETSPYLLQHAHNPVDWYPWGDEAFQRAQQEDKPILLSIGYSSCHWCHVMERESFEDEAIARQMNQGFVSIKVDREERPDVDSIYMQALQAMTGRGGWPMTMFLTPHGKPFYGGSYFPPRDRQGMPGFPRVLQAAATAYHTQRDGIAKAADEIVRHLERMTTARPVQEPMTPSLLDQAARSLAQAFDSKHGGFGEAPKFPQPLAGEFLLRSYHRTGEPTYLHMVELTLQRMARGGIYDHLGGGFHRYSTDPFWQVPHFEKMLYDNALLSRLYLHAHQATGNAEYRRVAQETLDYVLRDMTDPQGGFYSAQDADSEGEEGRYYLWSAQEIQEVLGAQQAEAVRAYFGVTWEGNFEGRNILSMGSDVQDVAQRMGLSEQDSHGVLASARQRLLEHRQRRLAPLRDEKVLTAWNGLMLRSLAEAASILEREDYLHAARSNASFLLAHLRQDGRLLRSYRDGRAKLKGYLEDHAFLADGLLALYEATFEQRWLEEAHALAAQMIALFWSGEENVFYDTGADQERLVVRPRDIFDNAAPCGGSVAAEVLLRLSALTGDGSYQHIAIQALQAVQPFLAQAPSGFPGWLCALDFHLSIPKEVAIVGHPQDLGTIEMRRAVFGRFLPNKVVAGYSPDGGEPLDIPLLEGRGAVDGRPTAYVCENFVCMVPATSAEALGQQLDAKPGLPF